MALSGRSWTDHSCIIDHPGFLSKGSVGSIRQPPTPPGDPVSHAQAGISLFFQGMAHLLGRDPGRGSILWSNVLGRVARANQLTRPLSN